MRISKQGKEWRVIKVYKKFYLCECEIGYKECFSKFEIEGVSNRLTKHNKILYLDNEPISLRDIMMKYNLTRSQVAYRRKKKIKLPDGKLIKEHLFL